MHAAYLPRELPQGYYLNNFRLVLDFIQKHHIGVLSAHEQNFIQRFESLEQSAQYLYLRLISRKGPLFRSDKLKYAEIPAIHAAAGELAQYELLDIDPEIEFPELAAILLKSELQELFSKELEDFEGGSKAELIQFLLEHTSGRRFRLELPFNIYEPLELETVEVFRLLFFGNLHQDFTEFVLQDLGLTRYEDYPIRPQDSIFQQRETIETYRLLHSLFELAWQLHEEGVFSNYPDILENIPPRLDEPRLERQRSRLINFIARDYERLEDRELALQLYAQSSEAPARERRLRILMKQGAEDKAAGMCERILENPLDEDEREAALRFQRKLQGKAQKRHSDRELPHIDLQLKAQPQVEIAVQQHFMKAGSRAYYVENALLLGLFGLCFWKEIFTPLKGCFFNHFQAGPADLFTPSFQPRRAELFDKRITVLQGSPDLETEILALYHEKAGISNYLVNWGLLGEELLTNALRFIPREHLITMFRRLLFDLRNNRSGLPDLVLFDEQAASYRFVEVKGPGDRLQRNQKRWLNFFQQQGIPFQVAWVSWQD